MIRLGLIAEMIRVALSAIWANKLRSFLTTLGNIVAVASIVAIVSLIQGINDEVSSVILSQVGADSFMVDRVGPVMNMDEMERMQRNPRITLDDAAAVRLYAPNVTAVMAEADRSGEVGYREHVLESVDIQGVTAELTRFSKFNAERGRLMTRTEIDRRRNVTVLGWDTADRLFGR